MTTKFGCVYKFESNQVTASENKPKFHVAICIQDCSFLFINSNGFEDSFEIDKNDWDKMPNEFSFIACNSVIRYSKEYFRDHTVTHEGYISDECLKKLRDHLSGCDSLEAQDLNYLAQEFDKNI